MKRLLNLLSLGALFLSYASARATPNAIYTYDPASGRCLAEGGSEGLNQLDATTLFAGGTTSGTQVTFTGVDAQCVDFSAFNLNKYLRAQGYKPYFILDSWDLRGAKLDAANLTWTTISAAQLAGAKLDKAIFGYTTIHGTVDSYTVLNSVCTVQAGEAECIR